jgi:hypothetical protein
MTMETLHFWLGCHQISAGSTAAQNSVRCVRHTGSASAPIEKN